MVEVCAVAGVKIASIWDTAKLFSRVILGVESRVEPVCDRTLDKFDKYSANHVETSAWNQRPIIGITLASPENAGDATSQNVTVQRISACNAKDRKTRADGRRRRHRRKARLRGAGADDRAGAAIKRAGAAVASRPEFCHESDRDR